VIRDRPLIPAYTHSAYASAESYGILAEPDDFVRAVDLILSGRARCLGPYPARPGQRLWVVNLAGVQARVVYDLASRAIVLVRGAENQGQGPRKIRDGRRSATAPVSSHVAEAERLWRQIWRSEEDTAT
jgi:hypothetical protein